MNDPTLLVLASLAEGDKHGYAILTDVKTFADVELGACTCTRRFRASRTVASSRRYRWRIAGGQTG